MKSAKRRRGRDTKKELLLLIRDHISARARALALEMGPDQSYTSSSWPNLEKSGYLHIACSLQCHFPHLEGLTKKHQKILAHAQNLLRALRCLIALQRFLFLYVGRKSQVKNALLLHNNKNASTVFQFLFFSTWWHHKSHSLSCPLET